MAGHVLLKNLSLTNVIKHNNYKRALMPSRVHCRNISEYIGLLYRSGEAGWCRK